MATSDDAAPIVRHIRDSRVYAAPDYSTDPRHQLSPQALTDLYPIIPEILQAGTVHMLYPDRFLPPTGGHFVVQDRSVVQIPEQIGTARCVHCFNPVHAICDQPCGFCGRSHPHPLTEPCTQAYNTIRAWKRRGFWLNDGIPANLQVFPSKEQFAVLQANGYIEAGTSWEDAKTPKFVPTAFYPHLNPADRFTRSVRHPDAPVPRQPKPADSNQRQRHNTRPRQRQRQQQQQQQQPPWNRWPEQMLHEVHRNHSQEQHPMQHQPHGMQQQYPMGPQQYPTQPQQYPVQQYPFGTLPLPRQPYSMPPHFMTPPNPMMPPQMPPQMPQARQYPVQQYGNTTPSAPPMCPPPPPTTPANPLAVSHIHHYHGDSGRVATAPLKAPPNDLRIFGAAHGQDTSFPFRKFAQPHTPRDTTMPSAWLGNHHVTFVKDSPAAIDSVTSTQNLSKKRNRTGPDSSRKKPKTTEPTGNVQHSFENRNRRANLDCDDKSAALNEARARMAGQSPQQSQPTPPTATESIAARSEPRLTENQAPLPQNQWLCPGIFIPGMPPCLDEMCPFVHWVPPDEETQRMFGAA